MQDLSFPTLLNKKAQILMSLNRMDLSVLAGCLILTSITRIDGLWALSLAILAVVVSKLFQRKMPRGFLNHLRAISYLEWSYKLGGLRG